MIPLSVLDLAPVPEGSDARQALANTTDLAQHVERLGYHRYWLAEHHNMPGIASAATAVVIGHVAAHTSTLRVGAGGIMLPNHAPLVVAEQFGTLAALYPGRIDLGLGRAPGTDPVTMRALRRYVESAERFPEDVLELAAYFDDASEERLVRAYPGAGLDVPLWLLGSSLFSARLAAQLGLPFAFASHFAPGHLEAALHVYRANFEPSKALAAPYVLLCVNAVAADTNHEAERLMTSLYQAFLALRRGRPGKLPPPVERMDGLWTREERALVEHTLQYSFVGSPKVVKHGLDGLVQRFAPDEIMVTAQVFDHAQRLRSFELVAQAWGTSR
jgi:luciferase family oxidoreductase group 1